MDATVKMYWQDASTISSKYEQDAGMLPSMLALLGAYIVEVFDAKNRKRRRYTSSLSARYVEKDLLSANFLGGPMTPSQESDFDKLRNALRYAESVFAEAL